MIGLFKNWKVRSALLFLYKKVLATTTCSPDPCAPGIRYGL